MTSIQSIRSLTIDIPPSCVAFSPASPEYLVIGTYLLEKKEQDEAADEESQKRSGSLILLKAEGDELLQLSTIPTSYAILDIQFSPHEPSLLCAATSTGSLALFRVFTASAPAAITPLAVLQLFDPSVLVLDLEWHPKDRKLVGVTLSNGDVALCRLPALSPPGASHPTKDAAGGLSTMILSHELEAWTLAFTHDGDGIYSGGDDSALRFSSLPWPLSFSSASAFPPTSPGSDSEDDSPAAPPCTTWLDRRSHTAGVTAILPLSLRPSISPSSSLSTSSRPLPLPPRSPPITDILVTGSYDDHIRILHAPPHGRRQVLADLDLGGGVWRLKHIGPDDTSIPATTTTSPSDGDGDGDGEKWILLASCMHAGARVLQITRRHDNDDDDDDDSGGALGRWSIRVLARFEEHESMNYGSDVMPWSVGPESRGTRRTVVSTSFYDRRVCMWRVDVG